MTDTLLKIGEAAKMLGVSIRTFERWKAAGDIPVVQFGPQTIRYRLSDIQAIIAVGGFGRQEFPVLMAKTVGAPRP